MGLPLQGVKHMHVQDCMLVQACSIFSPYPCQMCYSKHTQRTTPHLAGDVGHHRACAPPQQPLVKKRLRHKQRPQCIGRKNIQHNLPADAAKLLPAFPIHPRVVDEHVYVFGNVGHLGCKGLDGGLVADVTGDDVVWPKFVELLGVVKKRGVCENGVFVCTRAGLNTGAMTQYVCVLCLAYSHIAICCAGCLPVYLGLGGITAASNDLVLACEELLGEFEANAAVGASDDYCLVV